MSFELISGKLRPELDDKKIKPSYDTSNESTLGWLTRNTLTPLSGLASGVLGAVPNAFSFAAGLGKKIAPLFDLGEVTDINIPFMPETSKKINDFDALSFIQNLGNKYSSKNIQKSLGDLTGGYLTPEDGIAKKLTGAARGVGELMALGLNPASAVLSVGAQKGIKAAGGGPLLQAGAAVLGGSLRDLWKNASPIKFKDWANKIYPKNYTVANKLAPKLTGNAVKIKSTAQELLSELGGSLKGKSDLNAIRSNLNKISKAVDKNGVANAGKMWKIKKELNGLIAENLNSDSNKALGIYKRAIRPVIDFMDDVSKKNPSFGKPYQLAEDLFKLTNIKGNVLNVVKADKSLLEHLKDLPYATAALLGGSAKLLGKKAIIPIAIGKRSYDIYKLAKGNPSIQNRLLQIASDSATGNIKNLPALFTGLNKEIKESFGEKKDSKFELISGKLKKY